jgi:hypothetical protein
MKTIKKISVLFIALAISGFVSSCGSDDGGGGGGSSVSEGVMKAKVDGNWVTTESMTGAATLVESAGALTLQGNTGGTSSKAFMFVINGFEGQDTYVIGGENSIYVNASYTEITVDMNNPMNTQSVSWQAPYSGGGEVGKIVFSEVTDTHVKGTFEFTAKKNTGDGSLKTISEGSFNLKITRH